MTDPNNETSESTDSEQPLNQTPAPSDAGNNNHNAEGGLAAAESTNGPSANLVAEPSAQTNEPKQSTQKAAGFKGKKNKSKGKPKQDRERKAVVSEKFARTESRGFQLSPDGLLRHFLACRVCCYFLSGVQVLYGRDVVDRMVSEFDGTWMYVPLTRETRTLLHKTYGVRVDEGDFFIEHACEVCCRRFVIDMPEPEDFVATEEDEAVLEEPERREPIIFEQARTREDREPDWGQDKPMMLVEFKHRR
ncbi:MAG: hypothetical protein AB8G95_03900 [Anaerolineae bacterium]